MPELHAGSERRIAGLHKLSAVSDTASRGGSVPPEFVAGEGFPGSAGAGTTASGTGGSSRTRVVKGFGTTVREPLPALSPARSALSLGGTRPAKA